MIQPKSAEQREKMNSPHTQARELRFFLDLSFRCRPLPSARDARGLEGATASTREDVCSLAHSYSGIPQPTTPEL